MKVESGTQNGPVLVDTIHKKTVATPAKAAQQPGAAYSVQLSAAVEQMKTTPEDDTVRLDKVAAIRDKLASGAYNISGKDVANKILSALKG